VIGARPRSYAWRMLGASFLDADTFEEVEADRGATWQGASVVMMAALSGALGSLWLHAVHRGIPGPVAMLPVTLELLEPLVLWVGSSFFAYMVGATFFRGPETETDYREVLRTVGFAFTPAIFRLVGFLLPGIQGVLGLGPSEAPRILFNFVLEVWVLVAGTVAIRQALDYDTPRAIGTFGVAFLLLVLVLNGLSATLESPPEIILLVLDFLRAVF
jgi:hypothetical protein